MAEGEGDGKTGNDRAAVSGSNVESDTGDGAEDSHETAPCPPRVSISFYHYRKRLVDWDNLSIKAILDGIVNIGILKDDSPKEIKEAPRHFQKKSLEEKIIVIITEEEG